MIRANAEAMLAYFQETIALSHRLTRMAEEVHEDLGLSAGKRGILMELDRTGPQTVPQMARSRPVSRQHIQTLVNPLEVAGYVKLIDNPAHKRSRLVRLTKRGETTVSLMKRREADLLGALELDLGADELAASATVMRRVRKVFEGKSWAQVLNNRIPAGGKK